MSISIPRSFGPFGKSQSGLAARMAGPVLGSLAGAAASWALYSFVRRSPSMLSDLASQLRGWVPHAKRSADPSPASPPLPLSLPLPLPEERQPPQARDWTQAVLQAMKTEPREYGFAKMEWSAPLLGQYLEKHHGQSIPLNRIRNTLKESGYEWHVTRYRKAHKT
jgi:hypothetical protein